jgi:murein DD-endopeptidase MepM/ murein hydrolase activator NlpD
MMENAPFKPFSKRLSIALLAVSAATACASVRAPGTVATAPTGGPAAGESLPLDIHAEISASEISDGSIALVSVILPPELRRGAISGKYEDIALPFYPSPERGEGVYEAVLGVPYSQKPGPGKVLITAGEKSLELPFTVVEGQYLSEKLKVAPSKVNPTKKKDLARIKRELAEIVAVYRTVTESKLWKGPFRYPIDSPVTSAFGTRRVYNGKMNGFHGGLDLKAAVGTPIVAPAGGTVALSKNLFYLGNTVMIDHGYGLITIYGHMTKLKVRKGQRVQPGKLLGTAGKTGRVTGPHLHWQAVVHGTKVNPVALTQVLR